MGLSVARAARLAPLLEELRARPWQRRVEADPVEFPHRYEDPRDVEVTALLSASLAYGRADLFKPKIAGLLEGMGRSPSRFVTSLTVAGARKLTDGFVYRFNLPADVAVLLLGMGRALETHGSLEGLFIKGLREEWHSSLTAFTGAIRDAAPRREIRTLIGKERGLDHLLPIGTGAHKRLNLFLRWMVRAPDGVDFGVWPQVSARSLVIPLDTHIARISRLIGLTRRADQSWRTAEEITASLRLIDPADPVRFDFSLCHLGMSGACPVKPVRENCLACPLRSECRVGRKL